MNKQEERISKTKEQLKRINEELEKRVDERTKQVIFFEKMASIGQLTSGIGHELNNPINYILNYANVLHEYLPKLQLIWTKYEQLEKENLFPDNELCREILTLKNQINYEKKLNGVNTAVENIVKGSKRVAGIVQSMRLLTRKDSQRRGKTDLNKIVEETIIILSNKLKLKEISLQTDLSPDMHIECFSAALGQVILNLLDNAIYAVPEFGKIRIRTYQNESSFYINIKDNGIGISPEHLGKIFDPFFTTKPPGDGTGMGLNISYNIINELHQGKIEVNSIPREGAEFTVICPLMTTL